MLDLLHEFLGLGLPSDAGEAASSAWPLGLATALVAMAILKRQSRDRD